MPEGNPLVASAKSDTTGVTGIGIAESAVDLAHGVSNGDWVEAGLGAVGVGLEVLSMVIDPIGTIASYGVSWLIEHVQPLKEALDWFAGDPPVIRSFSETWANVAKAVEQISKDHGSEIKTGTAGWTGQAADAYRTDAAQTADAVAGAGTLADGISAGVMIMGEVVAAVRELVRDLVAEVVGKLITWALEAVATLGLGTPVIVAQATAAISKVVKKISDLVRRLVKTIGNVTPRIRKIIDKLDEIISKLGKLGRKADGTTPSHATTPDGVKAPDTTSPAGAHPHDTPGGPDDVGGPNSHGPNGDGKHGDNSVKDSVDNTKTDSRENECVPGSGDPVDLATGQMFMTQIDLELPGMLPLILKRTHFSSYRAGRFFGRSWSSTLDQRIELADDGVYFAGENGIRLVYPEPAPAGPAVLAVDGPRWPLVRTADGYRIHQPESGRTLEFLPAGGSVQPLSAVANRSGHRIDIHYDSALIPVEIRHSGGYRITVDSQDDRITRLAMADPAGDSITVARYRYDNGGRLTEVLNSTDQPMLFDYDLAGRITRWQDRNGEWYQYHYDGAGRVVRTEGSGGALAGTWDYDTENRLTRYTNSMGHTTSYHLNERSQIVRRVDPLGNVTTQEWDQFDRRLSHTDPLGRTTRNTYDEHGNLVAITRPDGSQAIAEYNDLGLPVTVVEPDGAVWRYTYDAQGNLLSVTDPVGAATRYAYDEAGNLRAATDPAGITRRITTDAAGLPIATTDGRGATTRFERDQFGRITTLTDPAGNTHRQVWTVEGNLLSRTLPDGSTARWWYDGEGNQVEYIDPVGKVSTTQVTHFDLPAVQTASDGSRLEFGYDTELRVVSVTNQQGLVWRYDYDPAGNLVSETDFNGRTVRYGYDAAGQLVERVNGAGESVRYRRDALGNIIERQTAAATATFEYDPIGRLVRAHNADAELTYHRDPLGRVLAETVNGNSVVSQYDVLGRRVYRRTPTGAESRWDYDADGRVATLRTAGRAIEFSYDPAGREVNRQLDTGLALAHSWDANHRLIGQTVTAQRERLVQRRAYHYLADGNLAAVEDQLAGTRRFEHDEAGRVVAVRANGWQETYAYDAAGNVTAAGDSVTEYAGSMPRRAGDLHYQHDAQGRVIRRQRRLLSGRSSMWQYTWDAEDRMTGVLTPDGTRWQYRYDPLGRRIAKQRLTSTGAVAEQVTFHWDAVVIAEQVSDQASVTWEWEPGSFRPISQTERVPLRDAPQQWIDQRFFSIVTDLVGTPAELLDPAGNVAWRAEATLWGQAMSRLTSTAWTPLRFPGQYFDPETQLHYNYARYYDPASASYHSADPLGLGGGGNPRGYVPNPLFWIDPFGLARKKCEGDTGNVQTRSGWQGQTPDPPHITRADPQDVLDLQEEMGHPVRRAGAMDQGVPGQYFASHAERQAAVLDPNTPIRINLPMCPDCQEFFGRLAHHRQQTQVVIEPGGTRTFYPDGSMTFDGG